MILVAPLTAAFLVAALHRTSGGPEGVPSAPDTPTQGAQPALEPATPHWKGALAAGAVWTAGNSETSSANVNLNAERRAEKDRWTLDAFGNYAKQKTEDAATSATRSDITQRNYGGGLKYDYFASQRLYYLGNLSGKVDREAGLDLRAILGAGAGYQFREDEHLRWGGEAGWSLISESFDTGDDHAYGALRVASNLAWQISKTSAFEQVAEVFPTQGDTIARLDNRLKLNITAKWIAQLQYVLDFDESPATGADQTDQRVVLGLGWSFGA